MTEFLTKRPDAMTTKRSLKRAPPTSFVKRADQRPNRRPSGGRTWWAHFEFTRINIELIILRKEIEERVISAHFAVVRRTKSREGAGRRIPMHPESVRPAFSTAHPNHPSRTCQSWAHSTPEVPIMMRRPVIVFAGYLVLLARFSAGAQTPSLEDLVALGHRQLAEARTTPSELAFQTAEKTFEQVLAQQPDHPQALMSRGELRFLRARVLVVQGHIGPSVSLFQSGIADMDRAVTAAPNRLDLRLTRGFAYGPFPALYHLAPIVRVDLETAVRHAGFKALPADQQSRVWLLLGTAYVNVGQKDQALDALRQAIEAAPSSRFATEASGRLNALAAGTPFRPDRFPNIGPDVSPLLVVVSFTRRSASTDNTQTLMKATMKALEPMPGLLGQSLATSVDTPGMSLLFTWWKDKQAVNDFYYSDFHQQLAGGRGQAITGGAAFQADQIPTQLGIEVLAPMSGGMQMGGGFIPRELFQRLQRPTQGVK